jgi:hypothetical protein
MIIERTCRAWRMRERGRPLSVVLPRNFCTSRGLIFIRAVRPVDCHEALVAHQGLGCDFLLAGLEPLAGPFVEGLLAEPGIKELAPIDIGLDRIGEVFCFRTCPERLRTIATLRVAVTNFLRV